MDSEREKKERCLIATVDKLTLYGGRRTATTASAGVGQKRWHMRRDRMSPCYTMRLADVPMAKL